MAPPIQRPGAIVAERYRIEAALGQGGFGAVFRATDLVMEREVALKMLLPGVLLDAEGVARFEREAALARRLEHPHTVRIYDVGREASGAPFFVMEILRGRPLDEVLRQDGPLALPRVTRLAEQTLRSLMEAHAQGIVHRDIKPSNLMLCAFAGEADFVKVLDFGIAKRHGAAATAAPVTREGSALGTPLYMAPEQALGETAGPPADLYALGLVMAEALWGRPVFEGGMAVLVAKVSDAPTPLSDVVRASALGSVIERATRRRPEERFASAADMARALDGVTRGTADTAAYAALSAPMTAVVAAPAITPHLVPEQGSGPAATVAPAKGPSSRGGMIAVGAVLGVIGLAGVGAAALLAYRNDRPAAPGRATGSVDETGVSGGSFRHVNVRDRITKAGYKIVSETPPGGACKMVFFHVQGKKSGAVTVYDCPTAAQAIPIIEHAKPWGSLARDGGRLVLVQFDGDAKTERELLAAITR